MSTDTDVLEQACRNMRDSAWTLIRATDTVPWFLDYERIPTEYHRLLKLKRAKKKWKP